MMHDVINRLSPAKMPQVVVPVTPSTGKIYVKVDGVPFVYKRRDLPNGWLRLSLGEVFGHHLPNHPPAPGEIQDYLALLKPSLRLIVIYRLDDDTWLCYPYNRGDAFQKGWNGEPLPVYLVSDTIEPFDTILACGPMTSLVFWRPIGSLEDKPRLVAEIWQDGIRMASPEAYEARRIARGRIENERINDARIERDNKLRTFEGRLLYHLGVLEAELVSWKQSGRDIVVEWRDGDHQYSSRIQPNMQVTSAGICLSNRDSDFSIASLVDVMREARRLNRPGADGDYDED